MLSMQRGSCAAKQQLKNPTNCSFLTSDRARIAVALGSLETLDQVMTVNTALSP